MNGLIKKITNRINWAFRSILKVFFRFDDWHANTYQKKPYAIDIVKYLNSDDHKTDESILEIGCGLGDIIRHIHFYCRTGADVDERVLNAARFLAKLTGNNDIKFIKFIFPDSKLEKKYNKILLVNWIHAIEPDILKKEITSYFKNNLLSNGEIVIDTVKNNKYTYNHNINFLTEDIDCKIIKIGEYEKGREVFSIKKI